MTVDLEMTRRLAEQGDQPEPLFPLSKTCPACGTVFVKHPKRSYKSFAARRFCSPACANRTAPRNRPIVAQPSKLCEGCGSVFFKNPKRTHAEFEQRRFCSKECGLRAVREAGSAPGARCRAGLHEMTDDNIRRDSEGRRRGCKACAAEKERARKEKRRGRPIVRRAPRRKPAPKPAPVPVERPVWRPAGFAAQPDTRRAS